MRTNRPYNRLLAGIGCLLLTGACDRTLYADPEIAVVPRPAAAERGDGTFRLSAGTPVRYVVPADATPDELKAWSRATDALGEAMLPFFGTAPTPSEAAEAAAGAVNFLRADTLPHDAYRLTIAPERIDIVSGGPQGAFYAVQTLRQLLPQKAAGTAKIRAVELPAATIDDRPALAYRGLMLDVARHFFTVEEVKRTLDLMALHKMNVFHWHLTDDQGWRIEIERYPELTRTGAVRRRTLIGRDPGGEYDATCRYDETPYGGYYTQEEIREVVDYAARRFITVIPEIEFPGHAVAALASYPWLSCTGERYEVRQTWDIDDRVFCPGRETTFEFIEHVLEEVIGLFPSEYVHIGGDECPTTLWERCPRCRARMRAEGLASPRQLQGYATARVERFLQRHGRRLIGWDELLEGGVSPTAVVMSWRGTEGGIRAAKQGNRVIMAPTTHCYLDYYQSADTAAEPLAWGGFLPLEKVYSFNPLEGLTSDEARFVLGVQANLWTEYIPDFGQAQYMLLPRLSALAEAGWNPQEKDYDDFLRRLRRLTDLYDACGYRYAPHGLPRNQFCGIRGI